MPADDEEDGSGGGETGDAGPSDAEGKAPPRDSLIVAPAAKVRAKARAPAKVQQQSAVDEHSIEWFLRSTKDRTGITSPTIEKVVSYADELGDSLPCFITTLNSERYEFKDKFLFSAGVDRPAVRDRIITVGAEHARSASTGTLNTTPGSSVQLSKAGQVQLVACISFWAPAAFLYWFTGPCY